MTVRVVWRIQPFVNMLPVRKSSNKLHLQGIMFVVAKAGFNIQIHQVPLSCSISAHHGGIFFSFGIGMCGQVQTIPGLPAEECETFGLETRHQCKVGNWPCLIWNDMRHGLPHSRGGNPIFPATATTPSTANSRMCALTRLSLHPSSWSYSLSVWWLPWTANWKLIPTSQTVLRQVLHMPHWTSQKHMPGLRSGGISRNSLKWGAARHVPHPKTRPTTHHNCTSQHSIDS